ncbi:MAG: adenine-specific DNA-methyltransferase [Campylobacterota bacterium]|nr:adenine-specific DNA-methyltransferase [Campylobacterota bacterium]MDQ1340939.1 adenine-specific DNA-methyltransferase [Campylobacterota bacterium]
MNIIEEKLNDNSEISANSKQLEILKKNFPDCFDKNGNFIVSKMEEIVTGNGLELSKESYSLNWLGKSYARLLANENPRTQLKEDKEHNNLEENKNSQNILIKGDNLEVLKHLKNGYENQIKMIYIDPPYNTGGDGFVYNDDRKFGMEELSGLAGVSLEEAKRILAFTASKSNSHSAWLTFMYPRLYIARELLKDDGVIFISIDDNEASQLKLLCDEVFGEENFVAQLPTVMNLKGNNDEFGFAGTHEYTFVFAKQKEKCELFEFSISDDELEDWLEDESGFYKQGANLKATGGNAPREKRPNLYFPIFIDSEDNVYVTEDDFEPTNFIGKLTTLYPITNDIEMSWRWSKDKFRNEPSNIIVSRNGTIGIYKKQRPALGDMPSKKPKTIFYKPEYSSGNGTAQVKDLFGEKVFSNPKPLELLNDLIEIGLQDNEIVLDFFAGSGTTAHSVIEMNRDAKNRKFITVQLPELIDSKKNKIAYDFAKNILGKKEPTIFEITKERITRASKKIKEEISKDITKDINDYDLGFKIFETTPLLENPLDKMDKFDDSTSKLFDPTTLTEDDFNALLTTWKVHDGMKLTHELQEITFKEYKGYYGDKKIYFVHSGFSTEDLKEFIKKLDDDKSFEPNKLLLFGYTFESKYQREISEALASYTNKKSIEIDMIVRY